MRLPSILPGLILLVFPFHTAPLLLAGTLDYSRASPFSSRHWAQPLSIQLQHSFLNKNWILSFLYPNSLPTFPAYSFFLHTVSSRSTEPWAEPPSFWTLSPSPSYPPPASSPFTGSFLHFIYPTHTFCLSSWFFKKANQRHKLLASLIKTKRKKMNTRSDM